LTPHLHSQTEKNEKNEIKQKGKQKCIENKNNAIETQGKLEMEDEKGRRRRENLLIWQEASIK